jgi:peptidoglycan/xylan/chitin deacetylase (PgdA/CDA1 family)
MAGRSATRLLAAAALLGVAASAAVLVLTGADSGDSDEFGGPGVTAPWSAGDHVQALRPRGGDPVRNATPQPGWRPHPGPVPIFRYHAVGQVPTGEAYPELFVEPADFHAQMGWLQSHGYQAVDLRTVEQAWFEAGTLPPKPVVLSFDGVEGALADVVLPDLSRRGWPAVLVLDGEAPIARRPTVEKLLAAGWEVVAAGANVAASHHRLEAALGTRVANFSFPPGSSDEASVGALEAAGYRGATVTGAGFATSSSPYEMPRITVFGLSGVDGFAEAMRSRGEGVGA